ATRAVNSQEWWPAGGKPMLVIAAMQDTIAPPEHTVDLLEAAFPDTVTAARIDRAGHALLPEQPEQIESALKTWLRAQTNI
ncbi:MAG: alpha/beta hydrolase, partial [Pseudomonadota bacterium]